MRARTIYTAALMSACALSGVSIAQAMQDSKPMTFRIDASSMTEALLQFTQQSHLQLAYSGEKPLELKAPKVEGQLTPRAALDQLLKGTGLQYEFVNDRTVSIRKAETKPTSTDATTWVEPGANNLRLAQAEPSNDTFATDTATGGSTSSQSNRNGSIEQVVVTGTHIRGLTNTSAPIETFTRQDIRDSGVGTIKDFIQKLPQNFNGGASESTMSAVAGGGQSQNSTNATGINLRGLGNDSTLVLVGGRRVAPGNGTGNFVDVSMIPLAAVERVELVPDGGSAVYGSDAVGGVVNFILREHYEGQETSLRFGGVGKGDAHEYSVGQTFGRDWQSGWGVASFEYYRRTPLDSLDRSYTNQAEQPFTLLPLQERESVFLNLTQNISDTASLFGNGTFSHRKARYDRASVGFASHYDDDIDGFGGTFGTKLETAGNIQVELSGTYGASDTRSKILQAGALSGDVHAKTSLLSIDAKADGTLWTIPTGDVRFAIGGQFRHETFDSQDFLALSRFEPSRDIGAGFVEINVPLISQHLDLNLADRYEHYSDFGSTNNPRVGVAWRVTPEFKVRGDYGRSFKAPLLSDLNPLADVIPFPIDDPTTGSATNSVLLFGGNPDLRPETARTWSFGMDFRPVESTGFSGSLTYYKIHFKNRVLVPGFAIDPFLALGNEEILGSGIVIRDPDLATVEQLYASPRFVDLFGIPASAIGAIIDYRQHNLGTVDTDGVDGRFSYQQQRNALTVRYDLSATYVTKFDTKFTPNSPELDVLNTPYNPTRVKLRSSVTVSSRDLSGSVFLNFVSTYDDNRVDPSVDVPSWTTIDAALRYHLDESAWLSRTDLAVGVDNIADRDPPFVANPGFNINFDGANANALGRFFYVQLSKAW